jgi:hypothetical protein
METKSLALGAAGTLLLGGLAFGLVSTANAENQPAPAPSVTATTVAPAPTPEPVVSETPAAEPVAEPVAEPAPVEPAPVAEPVYVAPEPAPAYVAPVAPKEVQTTVIVPPAPPAPGTDPNWTPLPHVEPTIAPPLRPIEQQGQ